MSVKTTIQDKLTAALAPSFLDIENESYKHNVPPDAERHFKVTIVSEQFNDKSLVARHQLVYGALSEEMAGPVHALSLQCLTPAEWTAKGGQAHQTPPCHGGHA
jgi:BolA family transcriptional regulator, general stress-responsive regulator